MTAKKDPKDFKKKGFPSKYKKVYSTHKLEEYLDTCKDEERDVVVQENKEKGYVMHKQVLDIKLPSIEGYAMFLSTTRMTLWRWAEAYPEFASAIEKIKSLQKERLIRYGLEGKYNPTIAKLILSTNHGMYESRDITSKGEAVSTFNDEQIGKIADRIARRRATTRGPVSE